MINLCPISLFQKLCSVVFFVTQLLPSFSNSPHISNRHSALSAWSSRVKEEFLNNPDGWILVQGNEGGDLDSLASAFAYAWFLDSNGQKAIPLLQTREDALSLRPENILALSSAGMKRGHTDVLTIDELPMSSSDLAKILKGIVLVDHNYPRPDWRSTEIISILDHHHDLNGSLSANPRIIVPAKSCSSVVALNTLDPHDMPKELVNLLLSSIALDTKAGKKSTVYDQKAISLLIPHSKWRRHQSPDKFLKTLYKLYRHARSDLHHLNVRDLMRRDWKSDRLTTSTGSDIMLGIASIPMILKNQLRILPDQKLDSWWAVAEGWSAETGTDVLLAFNHESKTREIILLVRNHPKLFDKLVLCIEASSGLSLQRVEFTHGKVIWKQTQEQGQGRKFMRPLLEAALTQNSP